MSNALKVIETRRPLAVSWPTVFSLLTAAVAAGTVTLHLVGDVTHRYYLRHWDIDSGQFPKTTDWILINGYYGVVDRFVVILTAMLGNLHWLAAAAGILGLYVFVLMSPTSGTPGEVPRWLMRQPEWLRRFIRQMILTAMFVGVVPCALFLLTAFLVVPMAFGEMAGKAAAEKESLEHSKGCQAPSSRCVELRRDGKAIATGFVLDSSPSRIAIFDTQLQRGRVLHLDGLELISTRGQKIEEKVSP